MVGFGGFTFYARGFRLVNSTSGRINSAEVVDEYRRRIYNSLESGWLTEANHIFNVLDVTQDFEDYGILPVAFKG
jgi:hypothetical protein